MFGGRGASRRRDGRQAGAVACAFVLAAGVLLLAACVRYPAVTDIGGPRILPRDGHAVRDGGTLRFYVDLDSSGKYGDIITGIESPVARTAALVSATGTPLPQLEVPGTSLVRLQPDGPHGVLSDLTRDVKPGDVIIVTLALKKSGGLGVITVVE